MVLCRILYFLLAPLRSQHVTRDLAYHDEQANVLWIPHACLHGFALTFDIQLLREVFRDMVLKSCERR